MPSVENALEAGRKCEFDLHPKQQGSDPLQVRLLVHAGEVTTKDGSVVGDPVTKGFAAPEAPSAAHPASVLLQPFTIEGTDPALNDRANAIRLTSIEILRGLPQIRIAETPGVNVTAVGATLRAGAAGPEIVPNAGKSQ